MKRIDYILGFLLFITTNGTSNSVWIEFGAGHTHMVTTIEYNILKKLSFIIGCNAIENATLFTICSVESSSGDIQIGHSPTSLPSCKWSKYFNRPSNRTRSTSACFFCNFNSTNEKRFWGHISTFFKWFLLKSKEVLPWANLLAYLFSDRHRTTLYVTCLSQFRYKPR